MSRSFLCAVLLIVLAPSAASGQNCARYGTKARLCTKNGCDFKKVNNAKYKTCVDPAEPAAEFEPATAATASVCSEYTGARKCRRNAACDWAKKANEQWKTCIAKTPPTEAPTPAPATATAPAPAPHPFWVQSWRKLDGCCRQDRQVIAQETYTHEISFGVDRKTADKMCSDACTNAVGCTAFEVEKKKAEKRKPLRFRCELHSVNVNSVSRATPSCKRAQCFIKVTAPHTVCGNDGSAARLLTGGTFTYTNIVPARLLTGGTFTYTNEVNFNIKGEGCDDAPGGNSDYTAWECTSDADCQAKCSADCKCLGYVDMSAKGWGYMPKHFVGPVCKVSRSGFTTQYKGVAAGRI